MLPGGTIEPDDRETPHQGARRETAEEIGLDREPGRLLAVRWALARSLSTESVSDSHRSVDPEVARTSETSSRLRDHGSVNCQS